MSTVPFEANIRHKGRLAVIDMRGDLDSSGEHKLEAAIAAAGRDRPGVVVLNFHDIGYINSKGIALIVNQIMRAREGEYQLAAFGLSEHYREIFTITRLAEYVRIFEDEDSALDALSVSA